MKTRDGNIDLLRLVCMFLICLIHSVGYLPARYCHWLSNISYVGGVGFVLISGYYGIRFSISKILRLEGYAFFCAATVVCISKMFLTSNDESVLAIFKSYWFVHAYVFMMCFSLLVEKLVDMSKKGCLDKKEVVLIVTPILLSVFGWSFSVRIWGLQHYIPRTEGINTPFSGVALFAIYIVGVMCRLFEIDRRMNLWVAGLMILVCAPVVALPVFCGCFARYDSIFVVMMTLSFFTVFRRIHIPLVVGKVSSWLAPSVLAVYLYHVNLFGYRAFGLIEVSLSEYGVPLYGVFFTGAFLAMIGGLMLDLPRRGLCIMLSKPIKTASKLIDGVFVALVEKMVK